MGDVYGGASNAGRANGNLVELAGGTVTGNVVGGEGGAGATGNTISLDPGAEGKATTFGENSYLIGGTRADGSENKLTIVGVKDVKVAGVDGFQRYKFKLVPGTKAGDTLLTATKAVTFCNSTFKVDFSDSSIFDFGWSKDNHKINLITLENGNTFHGTRSLPADTYTFNGILSNYTGKLNADTKNVYVDLEETPLAGDVKVVGKHKTAATGNTVVVPDGTTDPNAIAALAASKDDTTALTENSVTVETGGTVEGRAVGADSYAGDVRKNTVTVKANGTVKGFVAGGLTATGTADSNTVTLDGVKIGKIGEDGSVTGGNAYGGYSAQGTAEKNTLTMDGSAVYNDAYGGYAPKGAATGNTLEMKNESSVGTDEYGGNAYGGYGTSAESNELTVQGSSTVYDAYGGYAATGTASKNTLTVTDSGKVTESAYGGYADKGAASGNTLTVSDSGTVNGSAYGSYAWAGKADGTLIVQNGKVGRDAYGSYAGAGDASGKLTLSSSGTVGRNAYGSYSKTGAATDSTLTMAGGSTVQQRAYGGYAAQGTSEKNKLTMDGSAVNGSAYGGYAAKGAATGNTLEMKNGSTVGTVDAPKEAYGGYGTSAESNELTVQGSSTVGNAYGGRATTGMASKNKLTVTKSGKVTGDAYGSYAAAGKADGTLSVQNGTVNGDAYGAYALAGDASGKLTLSSGGKVSGNAYGSYSATGAATDSTLTMSDGASANRAYGGYGKTSASKNSVTITGGTVKDEVFGGSGETSATDNSVTISGGEVDGEIYGGRSGTSSADRNTVTVTGGTVQKDVYGGSGKTSANGNKITLAGGTVRGYVVYGGYTTGTNTTATGNTITLQKGADGNPTTFGESSRLYGGYGTNTSGNTLIFDGVKNVSLKGKNSVNNFNTYVFDIADDFGKDDAVLKLSNDTNFGSAVVVVQNAKVGEKIWLVAPTFGIAITSDNVKLGTYENAAKTATVKTDGTLGQEEGGLGLFVEVKNVKYTFDLTNATAADGALLTSASKGTTTINSADVTLQADNDKLFPFGKGDTISLLTKENGKVAYTGSDAAAAPKLDHTYKNGAGTATVETTGHVTTSSDGKSLVLDIDKADYTFDLDAKTANGYTFIDSKNTNDTKIDGTDLTLNNKATKSDILSLSKGDTVCLLKKAGGKLTYDATGAPVLNHTYTNGAKNATIHTQGAIGTKDNNLVLDVNNADYTFDLDAKTANGYTFIDSKNTNDTKIDGTDLTLNKTATKSDILSLSKGDTLYLLKKDAGTLTYKGEKTLDRTYTNAAKDATIETTGTVAAEGNNLVLKIGGVNYAFKLTSATKTDGTPLLTSPNTGTTKIDADDVTLTADGLLGFNKDNQVKLLQTVGPLAYDDASGAKKLNYIYTQTAADVGTAAVTTQGTVAASGKDLVLTIDDVKYAFTLAPTVTNGATLLALSNAGTTEIGNVNGVTVNTSGALKNLKTNDTVYLIQKTGGTLTADGVKTVTLPGILNDFTGTVEQADNNLVLKITGEESLKSDDDSYPYVIIVKAGETPASDEVTVERDAVAKKNAIAALVDDAANTDMLTGKTVTVEGKVIGRAVGANSAAGDVTKNAVNVASGAFVDGFVAGAVTASGNAVGNAAVVNGTVTGNAYGGYTETGKASGNTLMMTGGTVEGNAYGSYSESGEAGGGTLTITDATIGGTLYGSYGGTLSGGDTLNLHGHNTAGNVANVSNYNFYLPAGTKANDVLLHLTSNADTNMQGSTVNVHADGSTSLKDAETVYLIKKDGGNLLTDTAIKQNVDVLVGVTAKLNGTVTNENNNLVLTTKAVPVSNSGGGGYFPPSPPSTPSTTEKTEETSSSGSSGGSGSSESSGSTTKTSRRSETKTTSSNAVTVAAGKTVKNAFGAYSAKRNARVKMVRNTLAVTGDVEGTAAGASTASGDVAQNTVTVAEGATISENVYGARTEDGAADSNTVAITGGKVTAMSTAAIPRAARRRTIPSC